MRAGRSRVAYLSVLSSPGPRHRGTRLLGALLALCACLARAGDSAPREYLDEETGATVTLETEALVFAYARSELAANARDYVSLQAAAVNRSGKVSYVLISYAWSTVDPRVREEPLPSPDQLLLRADDRRIQLSARGHTAREAGIGVAVDAPAGSNAMPTVYTTDLVTLRFLAECRHLALAVETERTTLIYDLWEDNRPALSRFVRHMSGAD
jgi:hypothetical protein